MIRNYDCPLTMLEHHQIGMSAVERDMARAKWDQVNMMLQNHLEKALMEANHEMTRMMMMNPPFTHQVDRMLTEIDRVERAVQRVDRIAIGFLVLVGSLALLGWLMTP